MHDVTFETFESQCSCVNNWIKEKTRLLEFLIIPSALTENGFLEAGIAIDGCTEETTVLQSSLEVVQKLADLLEQTSGNTNETAVEKVQMCEISWKELQTM